MIKQNVILQDAFVRVDKETGKPIEKQKNVEEKQYVLLLYFNEDEREKTFEVFTGRSTTRDFIINNIESINVELSRVLVEDVPFKNSLSVFEFMRHIQIFYEDKFDISEFTATDGNDEYDYADPSSYHNMDPFYKEGEDV